MDTESKIYVAGHRGMVGSAICRELERLGFTNVIGKTRSELDLRNQSDTEGFFSREKPEYVFLSAALVGGIYANMSNQAQFLLDNLQIECNIIDSAFRHAVKKLLFIGSSCIYPKEAEPPIPENAVLTGVLESAHEGYAIAKIAGLKLCEYYNKQYGAGFVSVMPCNLYGFNDNFDLETSPFFPALIRKFCEAKINNKDAVTLWGTGKAYREPLFVDDLAKACVFVMENYSGAEFLNVGYGEEFTIAEIAGMIKKVSGFEGEILYDISKPDGVFRKFIDSSKIRSLGWKPEVTLIEGIRQTYTWYMQNIEGVRT